MRVDEAMSNGVGDDSGTVVKMELIEDIAQVVFHGVLADDELFGEITG